MFYSRDSGFLHQYTQAPSFKRKFFTLVRRSELAQEVQVGFLSFHLSFSTGTDWINNNKHELYKHLKDLPSKSCVIPSIQLLYYQAIKACFTTAMALGKVSRIQA